MSDDLGDRMKEYEKAQTGRRLSTGLIYARIDGRGFSKFTRGMEKPFDEGMRSAMAATARGLMERTHAIFAYTQSDEISLAWPSADGMHFNGKIQKVTSTLGGMASSLFAIDGVKYIPPEYFSRYPHFDARVFELPSTDEVANAFLWRAQDAYRNAVQMVAQSKFSHRQLHKQSIKNIREMLVNINITCEDNYAHHHLYGTSFVRERRVINGPETDYVRYSIIEKVVNMPSMTHADRMELIFK